MNVVRTMQAAVQLHQAGQFDQAEQMYRQVLAVAPRDPDALHLLGMIEHQRGRHAEAQQLIRKATQIKPNEPVFYLNLAQVNRSLGKLDESEICLRRVIELNPRVPEAYSNLSGLLRLRRRFDEAESAARRALELNPNLSSGHLNLGAVLKDKGRLEEAIESCKRAEQFGAPRQSVLSNIGDSLRALGHYQQAQAALEEATRIAPDMAVAHWNLSLIYLLTGDLPRGFAENEWRLEVLGAEAKRFTQPIWDGGELNGRTILLHAEQGFGDTIHFIRYAPMVAQRGGNVVVQCQPPLKTLLGGIAGIRQVVARGESLPPFDVQAPLLSLPRIFGTMLETIPAEIPYIRADDAKVAKWKARIAQTGDGCRIGLVWGGNPEHVNALYRSMALAELAPLAGAKDVRWFSLQLGPAASQPRPAGMELIDLSSGLTDFSETAAALTALDLLITVDTAAAHVAGAIGRPVWILLSHVPDWRWLLDRQDSVWYPSARLFRQPKLGDWKAVVNQIAEALGSFNPH